MLTDSNQLIQNKLTTRDEKVSVLTTVQFGIQVDLNQNPENSQNILKCNESEDKNDNRSQDITSQKKKEKKRLYKKRKKQKIQQKQREARGQIGLIIQQLYEGTATFDQYASKLQSLVEIVYNSDFRQYLDQIIRLRVTHIQKSIWEYTQSILYENPFERGEDHIFYSQMVDFIYSRFEEIQASSHEIQQIINIYLRYTYQKNEEKQEIIYNNLALNTFNYMIETDQTLKNLIHICDKKISNNKPQQRSKIRDIIDMIEDYDEQDCQDFEESSNCTEEYSYSTCLSEEEQFIVEKKKKKKRIKESDLNQSEQAVLSRMENFSIHENQRSICRVSQEWFERISLLSIKYRSFEK